MELSKLLSKNEHERTSEDIEKIVSGLAKL